MIDYNIIGERIKTARLSKGFTQEELAELLAVTPKYMHKMEIGLIKVKLRRLVQIAIILECTLEYLIIDAVTIE